MLGACDLTYHHPTPTITGAFYFFYHTQKSQKQHPMTGTITHLFRQS
jgi:hypothetical protein